MGRAFSAGSFLYRVFMKIMLLNETTYINCVDKQYVLISFVFKALIKILVIYRNYLTFMLNMMQQLEIP